MKKILLLVFLSIGLIHLTNAQTIELIGMGVKDVNSPVLVIPDPGTVDHVVVEAAGIFRTYAGDPLPQDVQFFDSNETPAASVFIDASPQKTISIPEQKWGYYTATFNTVDAGGITLENTGQEAYIVSFTAYVYRTGGSGIHSEVKGDHAFLFRNGSGDPVVYNFTIPFSLEPRDVVVSIPFSDVNEDGRYSIIDVTVGALPTVHIEFDDNNEGERLHIETITVPNVPGDVTEVSVSLYSPNPNNGIDTKNGDSFLTSAFLLTTTYNQGCTLTQGYWKTHSEYGPASKPDATWNELSDGPDTEFYLSGMSWIDLFNTPVKGNVYYNLAHQFMAAYLNTLKGIYVPAEVTNALTDAHEIFEAKTPDYFKKVKGKTEASKSEVKQLTDLSSILADYNEGRIGPGHCDDETYYMEKSAFITTPDEMGVVDLQVYPNPLKGIATVTFTPKVSSKATIDIYNSTGQKVKRIYDKNVIENIPEILSFESTSFNEGLYLLVIQNGSVRQTTKVIIKR